MERVTFVYPLLGKNVVANANNAKNKNQILTV